MAEGTSFTEYIQRHEARMLWWEWSRLDRELFSLQIRLRNLEIDWRLPSSPDTNGRLRREKEDIRYKLEMLKIDLEILERRAAPLFKAGL